MKTSSESRHRLAILVVQVRKEPRDILLDLLDPFPGNGLRPEGGHVLRGGRVPTHAGLLQPTLEHRLVAALDCAAADVQALLTISLVIDVLDVVGQIRVQVHHIRDRLATVGGNLVDHPAVLPILEQRRHLLRPRYGTALVVVEMVPGEAVDVLHGMVEVQDLLGVGEELILEVPYPGRAVADDDGAAVLPVAAAQCRREQMLAELVAAPDVVGVFLAVDVELLDIPAVLVAQEVHVVRGEHDAQLVLPPGRVVLAGMPGVERGPVHLDVQHPFAVVREIQRPGSLFQHRVGLVGPRPVMHEDDRADQVRDLAHRVVADVQAQRPPDLVLRLLVRALVLRPVRGLEHQRQRHLPRDLVDPQCHVQRRHGHRVSQCAQPFLVSLRGRHEHPAGERDRPGERQVVLAHPGLLPQLDPESSEVRFFLSTTGLSSIDCRVSESMSE